MSNQNPGERGRHLFSSSLAALALLIAMGVAFSFSFTPLRTSQDEFWHLKTGKWIVEHGRLPENDIYTYTADKIPWDNHEWLTQILIWKIYEAGETSGFGGLRAVILFKSIIIMLAYAGFGLLLARRMKEPVWAALAAAMMAALARHTFYPRPPFISYLLLALVLWLFIEWRSGQLRDRCLWLLPPLFALWTNLHGAWLAGLFIVGAFWADGGWGLARAWFIGEPMRPSRQKLIHLSLIAAACFLATLGNPYGYRLYLLAWRVAKDPYLSSIINELIPPDWTYVWILEGTILAMAAIAIRPLKAAGMIGTVIVLLFMHWLLRWTPNPWVHTAIALPVFAVAIIRLRRPGGLALLLLAWFFSYQGIHHVRHLSLMAIMMLPPLAWGFAAWSEALGVYWSARKGPLTGERRENLLGRTRAFTSLAGFCALLLLAGFWIFSSSNWFSAMQRSKSLRWVQPLIERQLGKLVWPSYFVRNQLLLEGAGLQPVPVDTKQMKWLPPDTRLPRGMFMIQPYPVDAVNFLLSAHLPGPLWNDGNNAGYLMWRLAPEKYKLFTDNRYDIYGGLFIRQEHSVVEGWSKRRLEQLKHDKEGWRLGDFNMSWSEVLDQWNVQTIFMPLPAQVNVLLAQGGWVRVWQDYEFNIWVRDTPANKEVIQRAQDLARHWSLPVIGVIAKY